MLLRAHLLIAISILTFIAIGNAKNIYLVKGSRKATITIGASATDIEQYAAKELQRAIQKMSGHSLPIIGSEGYIKGIVIVIGTPQTNGKLGALAKMLNLNAGNDEQIAIKRIGNILYIGGKTPRAALYATYTFMQDVLGIRWLWPGDSGEFIPIRKTIGIGEIDISAAPGLAIRSLAITGTRNGDPDTDTWMARNRLNNVSVPTDAYTYKEKTSVRKMKGFQTHISGHNFILPDSLLKTHPEYIAELDGKRTFQPGFAHQLCWSNPNVQNEMAAMLKQWWNQNPFLDAIRFYPADNQRYCKCEQCKEMGDVSTRWQKFSDIIIQKVEQYHPGKKYQTYAYQGYKSVPQTNPANFNFIGYALYDASYRHLLSSESQHNELPINEMNGWLAKGANMGIRGYEFIIFKDPMFVPTVSWVTDQVKWITNKGMAGYASELPAYGSPQTASPEDTYWNASRISLYAVAQAMWDLTLSADSIIRNWCNTIYGPAANDIADYYREIENEWMNKTQKLSVYTNAPVSYVDSFLSVSAFEKLYKHFEIARSKVEQLTDTILKSRTLAQLALEKKMLDKWHNVYQMKHLIANPYKGQNSKTAIIYNATEEGAPLSVELQQKGWEVASLQSDKSKAENVLNKKAAVVILQYSTGVPDDIIPGKMKDYVEAGGLLIISATGEIPIEKWFSVPAVKWTGNRNSAIRKAGFVLESNWLHKPNDLGKVLHAGITPQSAFIPSHKGWNELAKINLKDGTSQPFLLTHQIGKGTLVLTTSFMGYGGGYEMFGVRNTNNITQLIENLLAEKQADK